MANSWASFLGFGGKAIVDDATKKPGVDNSFLLNPEYPHSQDARDLWWNKLQDWGKDPNYGAVTPDWDNIWNTVQNRVKQYYEGGPLQPGVKDRLRSSLARRGMSENPASDFLMAQTDAQQSNELNTIDTQQALDKANLAESGRSTWLNSLQNFQLQRPAGQWQTTYNDNKNPLTELGIKVGSAAIGAGIGGAGGTANTAWLSSLLNQQHAPQSFAPIQGGNSAWDWNNGNSSFLN